MNESALQGADAEMLVALMKRGDLHVETHLRLCQGGQSLTGLDSPKLVVAAACAKRTWGSRARSQLGGLHSGRREILTGAQGHLPCEDLLYIQLKGALRAPGRGWPLIL